MLRIVFTRPDRWRFFWKYSLLEIEQIGINSLPIVALMSTFMGAVIALQTASSMESPLLPDYTVGFITQSSTILEFSPTIISLILAGKVGSNVASEIGTMRVTEQIDALEIMGINTKMYLILPKIIAAAQDVHALCTNNEHHAEGASLYGTRGQHGRYGLAHHGYGLGAVHDFAGPGSLLWRPGARE